MKTNQTLKKHERKIWVIVCISILFVGILLDVKLDGLSQARTPSSLKIEIQPRDVKLGVGQTQLFYVVVYNGTTPFNYQWHDVTHNYTLLGTEPTLNFSFTEPTDFIILNVRVIDSLGNIGFDSTYVYDPFTVPNIYLEGLLATADYAIQTDGSYTWATRWNGDIVSNATNSNSLTVFNYVGGQNDCKEVYVHSGIYSFSSVWRIRSTQVWVGEGYSTCINVANPSAYDGAVTNYNGYGNNPTAIDTNIIIRNMRFNGSGTNFQATGFLFELQGARYCEVANCWFENVMAPTGSWAVMLNGEGTTLGEDITSYNWIHHNHIENATRDGIHIKDCTAPYSTGARYNRIENNFITRTQCGIAPICADNNAIVGNILIDNQDATGGSTPVGIAVHGSRNCIVKENYIKGSPVSIGFPTYLGIISTGGRVEGNVIYQATIGSLGSYPMQCSDYATIIDNVVVFASSYSQHGGNCGANSVVSANHFFGTPSAERAWELKSTSPNTIFTNNVFNGSDFCGLKVDGADNCSITENEFLTSGIYIISGSEKNRIEHNFFASSIGANYRIYGTLGTSQIRWNIGYKTEASGMATLLKNGDTITHGLVATPVWASITCLNATYGGVPVILSLDYTGFTSSVIKVSVYWTNGTAITADVIAGYWEARTWNYP